jgi:hypothetical protein
MVDVWICNYILWKEMEMDKMNNVKEITDVINDMLNAAEYWEVNTDLEEEYQDGYMTALERLLKHLRVSEEDL